jgi:hypothetical protein
MEEGLARFGFLRLGILGRGEIIVATEQQSSCKIYPNSH